ncbi:DUF4143 domain-containing protein [uncultured Bacteroides sp.]|uniref:DUF4143 domain-containing protein n=1 Tax=uncultured Bacteroides sp. TaxID=162156 RepID=UPI002AAAB198|nr:DUF4143 domain-containing protein [uncultured Bacteroides sp.]
MLWEKESLNVKYIRIFFAGRMKTMVSLPFAKGNRLFYHTWQRDEKHYYEIDFLLSKNNKICPIEVKSSGYSTHKSLDEFYKKYSNRILWKYLIYTKDLAKDADTILVPTYMTSLL